MLATHILRFISGRRQCGELGVSGSAMELLKAYRWPGNVRELENVLERATAFHESSEICPEHLPIEVTRHSREEVASNGEGEAALEKGLAGLRLAQIEREAIIQTLVSVEGNKTEAARLLGISTKSIYNKMKRHGLISVRSTISAREG